jgi:hypothetical protein
MYFQRTKFFFLVLALFFLSILVSCSKLTSENYDKLKLGMTYEQVKDILGSPDNCTEAFGTKACLWGDDKRYIKVTFLSGNALALSKKGLR